MSAGLVGESFHDSHSEAGSDRGRQICVMECRSYGAGSSDLGFEGTRLIWREARRTAVRSVAVSWGTFLTCLNESTMKSCSTKTRARREHDRGPSHHALSKRPPADVDCDGRTVRRLRVV